MLTEVCDKCEIVSVDLGCVVYWSLHMSEKQREGRRDLMRKWNTKKKYTHKIGYEYLFKWKRKSQKKLQILKSWHSKPGKLSSHFYKFTSLYIFLFLFLQFSCSMLFVSVSVTPPIVIWLINCKYIIKGLGRLSYSISKGEKYESEISNYN